MILIKMLIKPIIKLIYANLYGYSVLKLVLIVISISRDSELYNDITICMSSLVVLFTSLLILVYIVYLVFKDIMDIKLEFNKMYK